MQDEIVVTPKETATTTTEPAYQVDETAAIARYFEITDPSGQAKNKMNTIKDYLRGDKKEYDDFDMLRDLKATMFKLGTAPIGTSELDHLYNYAKIQRQIDSLEKERERYLR